MYITMTVEVPKERHQYGAMRDKQNVTKIQLESSMKEPHFCFHSLDSDLNSVADSNE